MIAFKNGGRLVQSVDELPNLEGAKRLYLDFETTSFEPSTKAISMWKGHRACGAAITADDANGSWYVPVRHHDGDQYRNGQIDLEVYQRWLKAQVETCDAWVNNNVKFDAHFAAADGATFKGELHDLTTLAKLIDSDLLFKGGYGLDNLSKLWLEEDISAYNERLQSYLAGVKLPRNKKAKDYGLVPIDMMAEYACQDVLSARRLDHHMLRRRPEEVKRVWQTEVRLTPVLYDIEVEGMRVDPDELMRMEFVLLTQMTQAAEEIAKILGFTVNPSSSPDCYEVLVNHYGLPVLAWNDEGNPSFDKDALKSYLAHPEVKADDRKTLVVQKIAFYRTRHTLYSTFVKAFQEHHVDGILHPDYNQSVRSGRTSCKRPNAQQQSKESKALIHPRAGEAFLCMDESQVEFRLIVHYINDVTAIKAYADNPDTDFHQWVADMCGIPRRPAKNVNFAIGYGAGKGKVTSMLASDMTLMASLMEVIDREIAEGRIHPDQRAIAFQAMCKTRGEQVYAKYHETLGGLRMMSRTAARKIVSRGYVFNAYGRRLHLSDKAAHVAFNRVIQSCAADILKDRLVAVAPRYNADVRALGIRLFEEVHDEFGFTGDAEVMRDPATIRLLASILEHPSIPFRVPFRVDCGYSTSSWAEASGDDHQLEIPRAA